MGLELLVDDIVFFLQCFRNKLLGAGLFARSGNSSQVPAYAYAEQVVLAVRAYAIKIISGIRILVYGVIGVKA
ncbi:hypothetical protein D3C86_1369120 [compost metagenome]